MPSSQKLTISVSTFVLLAAGGLFPAGTASAQQPAAADERCAGTICDFYYRVTGRSAPGAAGAQPAVQAAGAPPAKPPELAPPDGATPGGGLMGLLNGKADERCSGTFCDFYYGGKSPTDLREEHPGGAEPGPARASTAAGARPSRDAEVVQRPERERCVSPASDPWRCYR